MTNTFDSPDTPTGSGLPGAGPVTADELPGLRRRTSAVLVASQILGGLGVPIGIALAPVLATEVSGSEALSGLAPTASVTGTALFSLPLAALMISRGRRPGLVLAYLIGALGAGLVVLATVVESFPLLLLGMAGFGAGSSANLQARFAAADLVEPDRRGRAISTVIWATTIGSVLGPNIAAPVGHVFRGTAISEQAGPFFFAAGIFLLAALVVWALLRPDPLLTARALAPQESESPAGRSLRAGIAAVRASPMARLALVTVAVSHTAMVSIMVMTPVDMGHHGAGLQLIGLVISGHIAGMYAFSPVMGRLSDRFGPLTVIGLAVGLLSCAALLAGTAGASHGQTAAGLFVLGLGWSAGLVAGSALLTDSVPQPARAAVQGLSDLTMNTAAGIGGVIAGVIVARASYGWLNVVGACLLLPMAALALRRALTRPAAHAETAAPDTAPAAAAPGAPAAPSSDDV
ncbi:MULTISPECIES: MFS transporter [unclassified Streptomyces]|uniref:MFS transporter n=1 Tax=unclassified Streptomyces TaxID=2593676 RepID=UPI00224F040C|nr:MULTISPECIES: MFS transporter [unclassified Streptomyces]WSP54477.1 MFS transporter [Streptomyces sp. NBC_01241]WSU24847.1 MFS transporter [Streptomyces sp. NBC_01108]MCX4786011.1 MFS transporter [Streptomyces sp. NBC_01221]MCX4798132.1 MFS transporter [Streptomyces sp. NBC_01242]WSJ39381.1 MFS transporter [Streptomyces sp. NBC_01321]